MRFSPCVALASVGLLTLSLSGCGNSTTQETTDNSGNQVTIDDKNLNLVGEVYPLQYVLDQVAGDGFTTTSLTNRTADPRTMKITAAGKQAVSKADLVLTLDGFNPSLDSALKGHKGVMDVGSTVHLKKFHGATDYHFWLDPDRMATLADAVADRLGQLDPARAGQFKQNADSMGRDMSTLSNTITTTLATCSIKPVFTERPDFNYLGDGTAMKFQGLLAADGSGTAATMAARVKATKATTIYTEPHSRTALMAQVASRSQTYKGFLDPVDAVTDDSVGDYMDSMNYNLKMLSKGQRCTTPTVKQDPADDN